MEQPLALLLLGFAVGIVGTVIGAGGGFVLVPILLLAFPLEHPEVIASISLAVVFFNAASGSWAYARMGRIDYRSGWLFAAATIPGAVAGALSTGFIPRQAFNGVFGVMMIAAAVYLLLHRHDAEANPRHRGGHFTARTVVERDGTTHAYAFDPRLGLGISFLVGYVSSLLGIGGGIVHVPVLVRLLDFPVHVATATSHFILAIMALSGTLVHLATGSYTEASLVHTLYLSIGVVLGAPLGARLSTRVHSAWILRGLALAVALVGVRILLMTFE
jgi:uncharacterized membrane protein YfcA